MADLAALSDHNAHTAVRRLVNPAVKWTFSTAAAIVTTPAIERWHDLLWLIRFKFLRLLIPTGLKKWVVHTTGPSPHRR